MKRLVVLIFVSIVITGPLTFAQDTGSATSSTVDERTLSIDTPSGAGGPGDTKLGVFTAWDFIRMALILAAVVGVIYGIFFILKRSGNPKFQENRLIKVLSSKSISGSRALHLVEVGNQIFLVGSSENGVNLVSEILDKETLDGLKMQSASAESGERKSFSEILTSVFGKSGGPRSVGGDSMSFLRDQRQRVKNM